MALKPWYKVVTPREDLREGKPLDAAEFAVHLDQVRDGRAPADYQNPERFFERTYLTQNLTALAAEVIRRLSGIKTETSAVFNMATQFGGGKTHALTLLYHLAKNGPSSNKWVGVDKLLAKAGVRSVPQTATAIFVGTEFDSLIGRGGNDGTPIRKTPWGEIAFQLAGEQGLALVAEHENKMIAPAGDVIRRLLPKGKPCLILFDELMNYVSRNRKSGLSAQLYDFLHNLSETARGEDNMVLVVSIPASELEMTAEDQSDYDRLKKLLDRLGKAVIISAEAETSEIIRRRLFEWDPRAVSADGRVMLTRDAIQVCNEYADWVVDHRQQIPGWFPVDHAREVFAATYPFHPMVLSVFERKWQALPRFQQTRGILRLLALWVARAYQEGFKGAHRDPLISLGTAPLDDPLFRAAVFEQLGEPRLEGAVTADICGKKDSFAVRLDNEAVDTIRKAHLHRKVATVIFFESNGGQLRGEATVPEIRLAVAEPELDIGNVEMALEALESSCFFLSVERNRYRFSLTPNLNKLLADRRASIQADKIDERVRSEIQKVFTEGNGIKPIFFPEKSNQIPDRPALTLVVLSPEHSMQDKKTLELIESMTREYGTSARTFKSALIWAVADTDASLKEEARKALAWEDIRSEQDELRLDESQKRQLAENLKKAQRDLKECVWRSYKNVALLGKDNTIRVVDLGLVHSSAADTMVALILNRLRQDGDVEEGVSPNFLVRNWPPAFKEWSTKAVRDAFFASPQFPRLLNVESIKETIARGVSSELIAYVGKSADGSYEPFYFGVSIAASDVEFSEDMFIITAEEARKHIEPPKLTNLVISPQDVLIEPGKKHTFMARGLDQHDREIAVTDIVWRATGGTIDQDGVFQAGQDEGTFVIIATVGTVSGQARVNITRRGVMPPPPPPPPSPGPTRLSWSGDVPPQKWMNFYTKVLSKFAVGKGLKISINIQVTQEEGISVQKIEETKIALRELGLKDEVEIS
ncbi:hypothetical protein J2Z49_001400 [Desulfofundulus luciae]|uniref:AAA family ATPase n=1 Tax=Desulfofundulus luciae TaxID=74702 RepID=A0ABU0B0P0_9FIRM|nr:DUF499 domain-containing protein [Desulfofundulus luciae]MDQ0286286.1 hypothetical protein [Desulfofundulus luciae]